MALLIMLCLTPPVWAYTVEWVIPPQDMSIKFFSHGLYTFAYNDNQSWGVFDPQGDNGRGKVLFESNRDIQVVYFGDNLTGIYDSHTTEFLGIIDQNRQFVGVPKGLYRYGKYFTDEGLISVWNAANRIGYIDTKGNMVVKCQFRDGKPFRNGWALVKNENDEWMYINSDWDKTKKPMKIKGGKIDEGRQVKNGMTFVRQKRKWRKITVEGKDVTPPSALPENLEADAFYFSEQFIRSKEIDDHPEKSIINTQPDNGNINIYTASGNIIGYMCEGKTVVPVQFLNQDPENFDGDFVVVKQQSDDGMVLQGLLHKIDGDFTTVTADSLLRRGKNDTFKASFHYPATLDVERLRVMIVGAGSAPVQVSSQAFNDGVCQFSWQPDAEIMGPDDECELTWQVYADHGLLLWEDSKVVSMVEAKKASVGNFHQERTTAQQRQTIWVNINNPAGNKPLKATFSLSNAQGTLGATTQTLAPGTNARLALTVSANPGGKVNAKVTLDNGQEPRSKVLTVTPYKASYKPPVKPRVVVEKPTNEGTKKLKDLW